MRLKLMAAALRGIFASQAAGLGLALGLARTLDKDAWSKLAKETQAHYKEQDGKYVLDVDGGEDDVAGLKSALEKERAAAKAGREAARMLKELQDKVEGLGDLDQIKNLIEKLGGDEEAQLIKAGKIDEVVSRRTEKLRTAHEKALKAAEEKVRQAEGRGQKFADRVLENHIRAAASKAGVHQHAIDDALARSRSIFRLNDEGDAVQVDAEGNVVVGKDGKTPFQPGEWLEGMKEQAPHWFPAQNAGGGANGKQAAGGSKTVKRSDFDAMPPNEKATTAAAMRKGELKIVD